MGICLDSFCLGVRVHGSSLSRILDRGILYHSKHCRPPTDRRCGVAACGVRRYYYQ
jgi:hypothetical protein